MTRPAHFPIYCLNLARRPDRRLQAWQQFRQEGLEVQRIIAPDAMHVMEARGWRNKGARACALAHRLAWREARRRGTEAVIVFEDDVVLCQGFRERLENLELPGDWAVFYFGCVFRTPPKELSGGLLRVAGPTWDTHAYMIRSSIWEVMNREWGRVSYRRRGGEIPEDTASDVILAKWFDRVAMYSVWPPMAWQVEGLSNNENCVRGNYRPDGTQAIFREAIRGLPGVEEKTDGQKERGKEERRVKKRWGDPPAEPNIERAEAAQSVDDGNRDKEYRDKTQQAPRLLYPVEVGLAGAEAHRVSREPGKTLSRSDRGILLSPYSAESERLAYAAVRSLRLRNADLPVLVLAQGYLCGLDWRGLAAVKTVRAAEPHRSPYMWFNKLAALGRSPFAETIFVDCDFYFARDPAAWFDLLGTDDFTYFNGLRAAADIPDATFPNIANVHRMRAHFGVDATPIVVGGGHFFLRGGVRGQKLLNRVAELMLEAMEDGPASLYHRMAGPGNVPASDELAASIVAVEQQITLPVLPPGTICPIGMFMSPHQREEVFDFPHGEASFFDTWSGGRLAPDAVHFAAHGKNHPAYQRWITACCGSRAERPETSALVLA